MDEEKSNFDTKKKLLPRLAEHQLPRRAFLMKTGGALAGLSIAAWGIPGVSSTKVSRVWANGGTVPSEGTGPPPSVTTEPGQSSVSTGDGTSTSGNADGTTTATGETSLSTGDGTSTSSDSLSSATTDGPGTSDTSGDGVTSTSGDASSDR